MAKPNLASMNVEDLLNLRKQIDATLMQRRGDLERQLRELGGTLTDGARVGGGRRGVSALRGIKIEPKYRDPATGRTWAARGKNQNGLLRR